MSASTNTLKSSKFRAITVAVFALIISVIGYTVLFQSQAAIPNPPTVYLTPENNINAINKEFTVQVRENSGTTGVVAVQATFTYPTNLIEYVAPPNNTGSSFTTIAEDSDTSGKIVIARGVAANSTSATPLTGDQLITTLKFRTKTTSGTGSLAMVTSETSLLSATTYTNILTGNGIQGANVTVDATSPTVTLAGITNSQSIGSNTTLPVTITSTDNTGITGLDIYVDGTVKQSITTTTSPYTYQWNTTGLSLGNHTFQARAKDAYGNVGQSALVTVAIADKTAPTATLTAPTSPVKGTVTLNATASDTGGTSVTKVEFYAGSTLIATGDTTSPYQASWVTTDGRFPDGNYVLTAKAYDGASPANTGTSTGINVIVENTDKTAPTVPTNFRSTSTNLTNVNLAWNASTDNIGVTGYKITRNGTVLPTVTGLTLSDTGLSPATTYNYSIVAVDAAGNISSTATLVVTTPNQKIGDFTGPNGVPDGAVDLDDLAALLAKWKSTDSKYDLDKKGTVDIVDLAIFLGNYGK